VRVYKFSVIFRDRFSGRLHRWLFER